MTRRLALALAASLAALPATAQQTSDVSALIAAEGLAAAEVALADPADPTDRFALGAVRFLRGIEKTLQTRWRLGINAARTELPVLRLPVPPNPAPQAFRPQDIETLFSVLIGDMVSAREPLAGIDAGDSVALTVALGDLWFDINMNGIRDGGEALTDVAGVALTGRPLGAAGNPTIRFDTADAAWLAAYTHFVSAFAELVLAFEPTEQIARVTEAARAMDAMAADTGYASAFDMMFGQQVDRAAMIYFSLRQQPDAAHTRAARQNLLGMIRENRRFWARVAAETDNLDEWVPNDRQDQALGLQVPRGTGQRWLAVLEDAEALLEGTRLIPHWRLREGAGINLRRLMEEPIPVDIAEWAHGIGLMPFAEEGTRVSTANWNDFTRLVRGDALMFALFLN